VTFPTLEDFPAELGEPWHGSLAGYNRHGCRCEECSRASSEYNRGLRKKITTGTPPPDYTGPCWRCPYCSHWLERNGELDPPNCRYCSNGRPVSMSAGNRTPPTPLPHRGTWAEDL
jgi:hypothetical protein